MTPAHPRPKPARDAGAVEAEASAWVARRDAGLSPVEAAQLAAWRAADPRHEAAFQRFAALAEALQRARQSGAMSAIKVQLDARARARRLRRGALAGVAALMLLVCGRRLSLPPPASPASTAASVQPFAIIRQLPDGSTVELNAGAELVLHFDPTFRRVELRHGEALFHVAKDARHPFIVRAGDVDVRAIGTAFSVRLDPRQVQVLVTEGKVGLNDAARGQSLLPGNHEAEPLPLVAGKSAVVSAVRPTTAVVSDVTIGELERRLAWRSARLQFDDTELAVAVMEMNERNALQIALGGEHIGRLRISGSFSARDPRTFTRLAAATFGLKADERNGAIVLRDR